MRKGGERLGIHLQESRCTVRDKPRGLEVSISVAYHDSHEQQKEHDLGDRDLGSKVGSETQQPGAKTG